MAVESFPFGRYLRHETDAHVYPTLRRIEGTADDAYQRLIRELEALLLGERGQLLGVLARPGLLPLLG